MSRHRFATLVVLLAVQSCTHSQPYDQSYLRATDNWVFRREYRQADRLFNAFDYGHAILSETLIRHRSDAALRLEGREREFIVTRLLRDPPSVPLDEHALAPTYAQLVPEAVATFDWAHELHRQLYDIISDQVLTPAARTQRVRQALRYYRSRPDLALSDTPKSMALMEGQEYSLAFRRMAPRYNHLIWSYHWLQMGIYDALLRSNDYGARHVAVDASVARFFAMLADSSKVPSTMPMSAAIAPLFTATYPEAAIIFDNLHSLHDVVSDVLASPTIAPSAKRAAILTALGRYSDSTSFVTTRAEWVEMSRSMGLEQMGGAIP